MTVAKPTAIGVPGYCIELPCVPESMSRARVVVSNVMAVWGMDDDVADYARIIVTELLANAVEHTQTSVSTVIIERPSNDSVRIGVSDRSPSVPHLKAAALDAEHGRGLRLVAGMSSRWGYDTDPWGKVTWAVIEVPAGREQ